MDIINNILSYAPSQAVTCQGYKGIRQYNTSSNMKHKIIHSVDYNWWLKRLDTQLNETTNQNYIKVPRIAKSKNKKTLL